MVVGCGEMRTSAQKSKDSQCELENENKPRNNAVEQNCNLNEMKIYKKDEKCNEAKP